MTHLESNLSREDVLDAFALEADHGQATLERYLRDYPQYSEDLVGLSLEISQPLDFCTAPLDGESHAKINAVVRKFSEATRSTGSNSNLLIEFKRLRSARGSIPIQVFSLLRDGQVKIATIPRAVLARIAELIDARVEALCEQLAQARTLGEPARSFKSEERPMSPEQISFEEALSDAGVSPEIRSEIMSGKF